jgi:hypothetical protein
MTQGCRGVASEPMQSRVGLCEEARNGAPTRFDPVDAASERELSGRPNPSIYVLYITNKCSP